MHYTGMKSQTFIPWRDAIRGREQLGIEYCGGARSQGGTSGNAINSISPKNPNAEKYRKACELEFGKEW